MQLFVVFLFSIALSYGRTLIGRHLHTCRPMTGRVRVKFPNCRETSIYLDQCIGTCISWDGLPANDIKPVSKCTCCKPVTFQEKRVLAECTGKSGRSQIEEHIIREPKACTCLPCNRRRKRSQVVERMLSAIRKAPRTK